MRDETSTGVRAAIAAYVLWGLLTIYWKQLAELDPFELISWRILCATGVMALIITIGRRWTVLATAFTDRRLVLRLLVAALLLTANWTSYVWAVTDGHVIEAALGYFMAPLATMLIGVVVLHERATPLLKGAMGLAALAVVVLTVSYGRPPFLAVIIAASWSVYGLLKRQIPLTAIESLAGETFLLTIPAAIVAIVMSGHGGSIPGTATGREWLLVALSGVVTAVPLLLFAFAAQRVPFTLLGALQYLVPTINLALGWFVYDESMPADRIVGFALVWAALAAVTVDQVRRSGADRRARAAEAHHDRAWVASLLMRRRSTLVLAGLLGGLAACGGDPTTGDFRSEAEKFIESDEFAENPDIGMVVTDVACIEPDSTAISTTFTCTGTGPDGQPITLDAEITGERTIAVGLPVAPGPASTVAPTTVATTVPA